MTELNYISLGIAVVLVAAATAVAIFFKQRKHHSEALDMPSPEKDALFEIEAVSKPVAVDAFVDRWGDQIVGKPKVISTETAEERVARIHEQVAQQQAQQRQARQVPAYAPRAIHNYVAKKPVARKETPPPQSTNSIVVLYIMAQDHHRFKGYDLYQSLINAGLLYGKMKIFHFHQAQDPQKPALFSIASAINPGVIDIDNIDNFTTPGLTVFMDTSRVRNPKLAFETMVAVAEQLADDLDGYILDSKRQQWSSEVEIECFAQFA